MAICDLILDFCVIACGEGRVEERAGPANPIFHRIVTVTTPRRLTQLEQAFIHKLAYNKESAIFRTDFEFNSP
jgi:hypothetical protein